MCREGRIKITPIRIAVVGNCYLDETFRVAKIPRPDQKIISKNVKISLGGSATNFATCLSALGHLPTLFSAVATDETGNFLLNKLKEKGLSTDYIKVVNDADLGLTGRTIVLLDQLNSSTKIGYPGVCNSLEILLDLSKLNDFEHIHFASTKIELITKALDQLDGRKRSISIDVGAKTLQSEPEMIKSVFNRADMVFLNTDAFERLFKIPPMDIDLNDFKLDYDLIVTAGSTGIYLISQNQIIHQPAYPSDVVDTTGAGDAAAGGYLDHILNGSTHRDSISFAAALASLKIEITGGSEGHPTRNRVYDYLSQFNS